MLENTFAIFGAAQLALGFGDGAFDCQVAVVWKLPMDILDFMRFAGNEFSVPTLMIRSHEKRSGD